MVEDSLGKLKKHSEDYLIMKKLRHSHRAIKIQVKESHMRIEKKEENAFFFQENLILLLKNSWMIVEEVRGRLPKERRPDKNSYN